MKKIYLLTAILAIASLSYAQTKVGAIVSANKSSKNITINQFQNKAIGDTLMHFDGSGFFVNDTDNSAFDFANDDIDNLTAYNAGSGWTSDYMVFYSENTADFLHDDVDTAFYLGATSWFNPAGQSDDWFSFGPITVPASGATLTWAVKWNAGYRDGYNVFVSNTGLSNYTGTAIYAISDLYPNTNDAADTIWSYKTVNIPSTNNGQVVYIGFQHYANDMDVLYLDEISVIEANTQSVSNLTNNVAKVYPNPAKDVLNITNLSNDSQVIIMNSLGQVVYSAIATGNTTINTENFNEGVYFVNVNSNVSKVVINK